MARSKQMTETLDAHVAGKQVSVSMSPEVGAILENRVIPLVADAEILFSCLVRKRLTFRDASPDLLSWPITENLHVSVRAVLYELCDPENGGPEPKIVDFAVADVAALIPKTLHIEFQDGELTGTFELG